MDSEHLLLAIEKEAAKAGIVQDILLEVNIGGEESKTGAAPELLWPLLDTAAAQQHIRVKGLMAIPPVNDDDAQNRRYLAQVYQLFVRAGERGYHNVEMQTLSMGMSGDFENAIREGATLVRIGTAIYARGITAKSNDKNGGTMPKTKTNDPGAHHASSGALIRRFLPYLANYKMVLCLDLFCAALTTLCDIVLPKIMSIITNSAMGVGITLTAGIVLKLAALYFVLRIIDGAASYYMSSIGHIMGVHIETDMRRDAFDHLLQLDHTYYNNTKVGTIMGRITNDLFDVTEFAHHCPEEFFIAGIKIVASFVILCRASIPLTLAVFACVPLMGVVSVYLNGRLRARFRQQRVQIGELNSTIEDSLLGQGVVKAFAAEDEERESLPRATAPLSRSRPLLLRHGRLQHLHPPV